MTVILIVLILLVVSLTVGIVQSVFRIRGLKETLDIVADGQSEAMSRALEAERERGIAQAETQYLKATLTQVIQRPAYAVLSDDQLQQFAALIESILKDPNQLN